MTAIELKKEIDKELENLSEERLESILKSLREHPQKDDIDAHLQRVLAEDDNLLRRLAQ